MKAIESENKIDYDFIDAHTLETKNIIKKMFEWWMKPSMCGFMFFSLNAYIWNVKKWWWEKRKGVDKKVNNISTHI